LTAFTLIEVMIVVAIIALVAMIGIPAIYHAMHPESLQAAVNGVVGACGKARAKAIWESAPVDLMWNPSKGEYHVVDAPRDAAPVDPTAPPAPGVVPTPPPEPSPNTETKPPDGTSGQITDPISIDMFEVNFRPCKDDEVARVRFYPNGTCDEFTIVLHSLNTGESKKISLELVTAIPEVAPFP
jgi:prepilin-type N-terminal cleavage/methylation domain-containing protein